MSWLDDEFDNNELESYMNRKEDFKMTKGMVFDLYQDGKQTVRVMAINKRDVICLTNDIGVIIKDIDFENECKSILIDDISSFC
jgi:hypothetical protein